MKMERKTQYTDEDLTRMRNYEKRTGEKVIYTFEEKCKIYAPRNKSALRNMELGILNSINGRLNLDNADSFNGPDDSWKIKTLEENLDAIRTVLEGRL